MRAKFYKWNGTNAGAHWVSRRPSTA